MYSMSWAVVRDLTAARTLQNASAGKFPGCFWDLDPEELFVINIIVFLDINPSMGRCIMNDIDKGLGRVKMIAFVSISSIA